MFSYTISQPIRMVRVTPFLEFLPKGPLISAVCHNYFEKHTYIAAENYEWASISRAPQTLVKVQTNSRCRCRCMVRGAGAMCWSTRTRPEIVHSSPRMRLVG